MVSASGVLFASDDTNQCLITYNHVSLPRKLYFKGKAGAGFHGVDKLSFNCVGGVSYIKDESFLLVADMDRGFCEAKVS